MLTRSQDGLLGLRVGSELRGVDYHGAAHGGDGAPPEGEEPLLADDAGQGVEDVLVVAPLVRRKVSVRGHADQSDLNGIKRSRGEQNRSLSDVLTSAGVPTKAPQAPAVIPRPALRKKPGGDPSGFEKFSNSQV